MEKEKKQPLQSRAINTKKVIIDTSIKLFLRNGYKKTNTKLISKEAKVSIGIIYSYFNDKKELLELWLNSLLERCDEYFYNQFKLREYEVELPLIISNIIEKVSDYFFSSPIVNENDNEFLIQTLNHFYVKVQTIFIKSCYDAGIFFKNQYETTHLILNLIKCYNNDVKLNIKGLDLEVLKSKYVMAICALLK